MYKIATLNKISPVGLAHFTSQYAISDALDGANGILVRSQDMHEMDFDKELLAIARAGAGVNNIPLDRCADSGIVVFNTPGANANAVKELVLLGMLLSARNVPAALGWISGLEGDDIGKQVEKGKKQFAGNEISGKTLGIIGLGAIGAMVASSAHALGMDVIGFDAFLNDAMKERLDDAVQVAASQEEVLAKADYLSVHIPANDSTKGSLNQSFFDKMKDGAVLLNFSRDKLVNSSDLLAAVSSGKISRYVTDFATADILGKDGFICLPHLGASTEEAEDNCATIASKEIMDYIENGNVINSVNFPRADLGAREGKTRIAILTKGNADPVAAVKAALGDVPVAGGVKGDYGYVLAEADAEVPAIEGIVRSRVLK